MSQYPPPPPTYGAYDQAPPAGFGYPNQGPYYPQPQPPYQPGMQPQTCPPGPGGYYPGQPPTQTIEKIENNISSPNPENESYVQESTTFTSGTEELHCTATAPELNNDDEPPSYASVMGDRLSTSPEMISEQKNFALLELDCKKYPLTLAEKNNEVKSPTASDIQNYLATAPHLDLDEASAAAPEQGRFRYNHLLELDEFKASAPALEQGRYRDTTPVVQSQPQRYYQPKPLEEESNGCCCDSEHCFSCCVVSPTPTQRQQDNNSWTDQDCYNCLQCCEISCYCLLCLLEILKAFDK